MEGGPALPIICPGVWGIHGFARKRLGVRCQTWPVELREPLPENWPIGVKPASWTQVAESVLAGPSGWLWWLSFVDPGRSAPIEQQVPGGGGFLGVVIAEGDTLADAITRSHLLGVNPGGQVSAQGPIPRQLIAAEWRDRLLTKDEALSVPDPTGGADD